MTGATVGSGRSPLDGLLVLGWFMREFPVMDQL